MLRLRLLQLPRRLEGAKISHAKAVESTTGGVRLWDSKECTGSSRWVTSPEFPEYDEERMGLKYYSMSTGPPPQ